MLAKLKCASMEGARLLDNGSWQNQVTQRIEQGAAGLDQGAARRLQTVQLTRIARRLGQFSTAGCEECHRLKSVVESLVREIESQAHSGAVDYKEYRQQLLNLVKHLKSAHGLIEPGTYVSLGISLGLMAGVALQNLWGPAYLGLGLCLGVAIGGMMDAKAKQDDKEI